MITISCSRAERRQRLGRDAGVGALVLGGHLLAALEQRIAAEGDDDACHGSVRQRRDEDRLDRVHAVLGLLEGDVRRALEHLLGDLHLGDAEFLGISLPILVSVLWKAGRQCMNLTVGLPVFFISAMLTW